MKFFMPTYAVALTLAVTSQMVEQASAAACTFAADGACPANTLCEAAPTYAANSATVKTITPYTTTCPTGTFAYLKTLKVGKVSGAAPETAVGVYITKDGTTTAALTSTNVVKDASTVTGWCDNSYTNVGMDATGNVKAVVGCASTATACDFKYEAVWGCQTYVACDAATICTGTACTSVSTTASAATTTGSLTRPATTVLGTCATGKFAYVKKLQIFAGAAVAASGSTAAVDATLVDSVKVTAIKDGTTTAVAVVKDNYPACANQFSNIGSSDATADVKVTIGCDSGTTCNFKYKIEWGCQGDSFAPTTAPAATTAAPSSAVSYPVAAWGTALVAAVAGANFAAPL